METPDMQGASGTVETDTFTYGHINIARRHKERALARKAAKAKANASDDTPFEQDDDGVQSSHGTPSKKMAALMLSKFTGDRVRLKAIESVQRKIEVKAEILPDYEGWIAGTLEAADDLVEGQPNDVLTGVMLWLLDVGDIAKALDIAQVVLAKSIPMPSWLNYGPACTIAREVASGAFAAIREKAVFDVEQLTRAMAITQEYDMPDQARAEMFKALAQLDERLMEEIDATGESPDGIAGQALSMAHHALENARQAFVLDPSCGVKTLIAKLERRIKKDAASTTI